MGASGIDGHTTSFADLKPEVHEQELSASAQVSYEDVLIEKMENVALKSEENIESSGNSDGQEEGGGIERSTSLPLRPYAGDCPHYVRTGTCKFGPSCRFNHPVRWTQQSAKVKDYDSENTGSIECKYYSTAGGCKYGKSCRYYHPSEDSENAVPKLNFLGLPMRPGVKECPYFMRNGSCGYGSQCVHHHPDPISMVGVGFAEETRGRQVASNDDSLQSSGSIQTSFAPQKFDGDGSYSEDCSLYVPTPLFPDRVGEQSALIGYQSRNYYSSPTHGSVRKAVFSMQVDEFPERPGQPECDYFMKTGNCKFKSTCRFHHPKNRPPRPNEFVLSEFGLPLRPGRSICHHYKKLGLCKFGRACLFDHPVS